MNPSAATNKSRTASPRLSKESVAPTKTEIGEPTASELRHTANRQGGEIFDDMKLAEFLGADPVSETDTRFEMGKHLYGAFGGVFGGAVAACSLIAARAAAPGRVPSALDCRFLRGLTEGTATARVSTIHSGKSISVVQVEVADPAGKLAARSTISFVAPEGLRDMDFAPRTGPAIDYGKARPWTADDIPIVKTLAPRAAASESGGIASSIRVPWDDRSAVAEAACFAADLSVGPPVASALTEGWVPHPNPDISLRFTSTGLAPEIITGVGHLASISSGLAAVEIEVWGGDSLLAVGISTSLLLA